MDPAAIAILVTGGVVTGLIEAIKRAVGNERVWERWGALIAIIAAVGIAIVGVSLGWYSNETSLGDAVLVGIVAGLTSSGLYRAASTTGRSPTS